MIRSDSFTRRALLRGTGIAAIASAMPYRLLAQTPNRGGDLAIAINGASSGDTLDPRSFNSPFMAVVGGTVFNTLVETAGADGATRPGLALSWSETESGKVWRFDLSQDAVFHDGRKLTSADVIYSLMLHVAEGSRSNSRPIINSIETIAADGDNAVVITLKGPNYFFPAALSNYSLAIVPDGTTTFDGIGTGPYRVTRFAPGEVLETERFDGYFRKDRAFVDKVSLLGVNDAAARVSAIQSGQVQISSTLDARSVALLQSLPNLKISYMTGAGFAGFNMMVDKPPFDNVKLRQALKLAVDREDMIQRIFAGQARLGNDTPIPPNSTDFAASVEQTVYDPDRARALYAESGHSGPLVLQTSDAVGSEAVDMATLFAEHAAKAGITIEVKREPADGYWSNVWAKAPFHATLWGARPTSDLIMTLAYTTGSPANDTAFADPEFDAALATARGSSSEEERKAAMAEAQRFLHERGGVIIPAFANLAEGLAANLNGYEAGTLLVGSTRAAENVWFG